MFLASAKGLHYTEYNEAEQWGKEMERMRVTEKLTQPVTETKYLTAENVDRYRSIMRIFFEAYEQLNYWLDQDEVYAGMVADPYFVEYRPEQCQQDLAMLVEWKNLSTIQDTRNITTIEAFKNKKFRYQLTPYSVEIERLVIRLEHLQVEGASLEPSLLARINEHIASFGQMALADTSVLHTWWEDLERDFERLNRNYQDYMRALNSVKAEEMMRTQAFLVFKDHLVEYLRNFVKSLQRYAGGIEGNLRALDPMVVEQVLEREIDYEYGIPRLEQEVTREEIVSRVCGRYESMRNWFVADAGAENEAGRLYDATTEIIRRITRYAAQLSEKTGMGANRREEYRKVATLFMQCEDMASAHCMSARVFGLERPRHLQLLADRLSESTNKSVYEEKAAEVILKPRIRTYREKMTRSAIRDTSAEKALARTQVLMQKQADKDYMATLEQNSQIDFAKLPLLEPRARGILLRWLSDALEDAAHVARTEDGRTFQLDLSDQEKTCIMHAQDGDFMLPHIRIIFEENAQ